MDIETVKKGKTGTLTLVKFVMAEDLALVLARNIAKVFKDFNCKGLSIADGNKIISNFVRLTIRKLRDVLAYLKEHPEEPRKHQEIAKALNYEQKAEIIAHNITLYLEERAYIDHLLTTIDEEMEGLVLFTIRKLRNEDRRRNPGLTE